MTRAKAVFAALLGFASGAHGQAPQLVAVAPEGSGLGGLIVVLVLAVVGGLAYLKIKRPADFVRVMAGFRKARAAGADAIDKLKARTTDTYVEAEKDIERREDAVFGVLNAGARVTYVPDPVVQHSSDPALAGGIKSIRRKV
jgi:hypothetical protein